MSFWDQMEEAGRRYFEAVSQDIAQGLKRAVLSELGQNTLKEATPMRIRKPKSWTQLCNWLASLGLGNHYYPEDGPIVLREVRAITVHGVDKDGREVNLLTVMAPEWRNPWVNEDGTGPRRKQG